MIIIVMTMKFAALQLNTETINPITTLTITIALIIITVVPLVAVKIVETTMISVIIIVMTTIVIILPVAHQKTIILAHPLPNEILIVAQTVRRILIVEPSSPSSRKVLTKI